MIDTLVKQKTLLLDKLEQSNWEVEEGNDFVVIYELDFPYLYVKFVSDIDEEWDEVAYTKLHNEYGTSFFALTDGIETIVYVYMFGYGVSFEDVNSVEEFLSIPATELWDYDIFRRIDDKSLLSEKAIINHYIDSGIISEHSKDEWKPHFVDFANMLFYGQYESTNRNLPIQIIEDHQLDYVISKNASGGGYEGLHRTFLVRLPNNENVPFSISLFATAGAVNDPVYGNRKGTTQLNIAMLDKPNNAYNLQLSFEKYLDKRGNRYEIWHNGIRSRLKKQYVLQTVQEVADFLLDGDRVTLGKFPLDSAIDSSIYSHFIENIISYSYCRRIADIKYRK